MVNMLNSALSPMNVPWDSCEPARIDSSRIGTSLSGWRPNAWDEEFSLWSLRRIGSLPLQGLAWTCVLDVVAIQSESSCQAYTGSDINRVVVFRVHVIYF